MVPPPTEDTMRKRLLSLNSTQESVQTCSKWLLHHRESIDKIANIWMEIYKQTNDKLRIALIYVLNDVVQKAASKRDINVTLTFHPHLINATTISSLPVKKAISRCVEVFGERNIYPAHIIEEMKTALVSRIATEKDESQNATEIDFQKLIRSIESFYKNEMLTEKAREILARSSFNFKESVQGRVKDRNEGIKALSDMDSSRQKLLSFLDTVEKHKQKGLQLHEMTKRTESTFNLQLRDVTVINDAYERFAEGIKKTKQQLESMTNSGGILGESPPRDAPSPTAGDDPFLHGVDGEELAGGGDDMEMDDDDRPGPSGSSRCFLKTANEYTRVTTIPTGHIQSTGPQLNTQFIPFPVPSNIPRSVPSVMDPRQARFFASQQQPNFHQSSPSIPPPPGASPPPPLHFFQQTNGSNIEQKQSTPNLLSSPPPQLFNPINPPPSLIPRNAKFINSFNSSHPSMQSPPPNFILPPPGLVQPPPLFSPPLQKNHQNEFIGNFGPKRRNSSAADSGISKRQRNVNSDGRGNWKDGGGNNNSRGAWRHSFANGEKRKMQQYNRH